MSAPAPVLAAAAEPSKKSAPKEKKPKKGAGDELAAGMSQLELDPKPEFLAKRIEMFERLQAIEKERIAGGWQSFFLFTLHLATSANFGDHEGLPREAITITLKDGSTKEGTSWETSPMQVAIGISKSLADKVVIAKVCFCLAGGSLKEGVPHNRFICSHLGGWRTVGLGETVREVGYVRALRFRIA